MMRRMFFVAVMGVMTALAAQAKTLIVYYSYTNNVHTIVSDLSTQIEADVVRIEPVEKNLDYAANNYAIGSALISAIRNNPDKESSYPAIDPVEVNLSDYDMIIVAAPLWWGNMAAPLQSYLFKYGSQMAGKRIGLIVSSASSGISGVVADAKRLIPKGEFLQPNLWIRSSQVSRCHALTAAWLNDIDYKGLVTSLSTVTEKSAPQVVMTRNGVSVEGGFDRLSVYDVEGRNLLTTSLASTSHPFRPGAYLALLRKGGRTYGLKKSVK